MNWYLEAKNNGTQRYNLPTDDQVDMLVQQSGTRKPSVAGGNVHNLSNIRQRFLSLYEYLKGSRKIDNVKYNKFIKLKSALEEYVNHGDIFKVKAKYGIE